MTRNRETYPAFGADGDLVGTFETSSNWPEGRDPRITHHWKDQDEYADLLEHRCPECKAGLTEFSADPMTAFRLAARVHRNLPGTHGMAVHGVCRGCQGVEWFDSIWVTAFYGDDADPSISTMRIGEGEKPL